jgi:hypothetical protein
MEFIDQVMHGGFFFQLLRLISSRDNDAGNKSICMMTQSHLNTAIHFTPGRTHQHTERTHREIHSKTTEDQTCSG